MRYCALTSGSSGNSFFIENEDEAVLVDAGLSAKELVYRMAIIGLDPLKLKGILITHEHIDHIRGMDVLSRKLKIPVFATRDTLKDKIYSCDVKEILNNEIFSIGKLQIEAFSKNHGAANPVSYTIQDKKRISVITDAGRACKNVCSQIKDADALFLESNHDIEMLEKGPYPFHLKKLVKSDDGHLSNMQASLSVLENSNSKMQRVILSHLSKVNNTSQLALETFNQILKQRYDFKADLDISSRDKPTPIWTV
jgi:phosphoribosyl 1,2-cyclic phosphodiesterase